MYLGGTKSQHARSLEMHRKEKNIWFNGDYNNIAVYLFCPWYDYKFIEHIYYYDILWYSAVHWSSKNGNLLFGGNLRTTNVLRWQWKSEIHFSFLSWHNCSFLNNTIEVKKICFVMSKVIAFFVIGTAVSTSKIDLMITYIWY